MKKILFLLFAISAILISCNKHDIVNPTEPVKVEIAIENGSATKAVTTPASTNNLVCEVAELTALFADASGNIVKSVSFENMSSTDGKYVFEDVPATVSQVAVIAYRGYTAQTTLEGARALWNSTEQVIAEANEMIVYGEDLAPTTRKEDAGYVLSASVTVTSNHARIEVGSISCSDFGTYSSIALKKMALNGYDSDLYAEALSTTLASTSDVAVAGTDKVWSWNIKEQNIMPLVLDMEVTGNGYTVAVPARTLTVNSYKVNGTAITKFEKGNVYNFDINFAYTNIDSVDETISAEVTVSISEWVINETEVGFAAGN